MAFIGGDGADAHGGAVGFEHARVGKATLIFDNSTGRYDPRNAASALYPNIKPGRKMQVRAVDNTDNTQYTLFTGVIDGV
jgi:hypothetical protein